MKNLATKYLGFEVKSPIIVGSSGLTNSVANIKKLELAGAGAIVLKSVFEEEIANQAEQLTSTQMSGDLSNAEFFDYYDYQLKQDVLDKYLKLITEAKAQCNIPIVGSINCKSHNEWPMFAKKMQDAGADAIELNIFKLPFDINTDADTIEKSYFKIVKTIKEHVSVPVAVKIAPYFTNMGQFIHRLSYTGIEGLVLFNRFSNINFDIYTDSVCSGDTFTNEQSYALPLRWLSIMHGQTGCDLIASTGAHDAKTVIKMLMAGAGAVQMVSAIYKNGPEYITKTLNEISQWMTERGFESIDDFKGRMSQKISTAPEVFERVQFMKYFSDFGGEPNL